MKKKSEEQLQRFENSFFYLLISVEIPPQCSHTTPIHLISAFADANVSRKAACFLSLSQHMQSCFGLRADKPFPCCYPFRLQLYLNGMSAFCYKDLHLSGYLSTFFNHSATASCNCFPLQLNNFILVIVWILSEEG